MKLVVDTDVVAAALLGEETRGAEAADLLSKASLILAPAHWKAKLANVVWKAVAFHGLDLERGREALRLADACGMTSIDVAELWLGAFARAAERDHRVYDTLFVELAIRKGLPLASYDSALRRQFPDVVVSPGDLLAGTVQ